MFFPPIQESRLELTLDFMVFSAIGIVLMVLILYTNVFPEPSDAMLHFLDRHCHDQLQALTNATVRFRDKVPWLVVLFDGFAVLGLSLGLLVPKPRN
ncbi:MAG: hypothetical protein D6721_02355, partial [Gammaproteobacteria bacterium]